MPLDTVSRQKNYSIGFPERGKGSSFSFVEQDDPLSDDRFRYSFAAT